MLKRLWDALSSLITTVQNLSDTGKEIDDQIRERAGLTPRENQIAGKKVKGAIQ